MEHTALYRKYRPEALKDLIGQDHIVAAIEGALKNDRVAHAYLLSGSRGTGKTTTARILAKALGTSSTDLYEIDAASHTGVDNIREIRENVGSLPFDSKYKVYIIDEVHMLSKGAFNALLKTLEEPPAHAVFILATTELEKVPETIISRCQTYVFRRPSETVLRELLVRTAKKENVALGAGVADLLALLANGSFRDALGTLQKVMTVAGEKIELADVERITGAPSSVLVRDLIEAVARGALQEALRVVEKAREDNLATRTLLDLVLHAFRRILLVKVAPGVAKTEIEGLSADEQEFIARMAKTESLHLNSQSLLVLLDAVSQSKYAVIESLPLELALMKILGKQE
jgi:DNA polymerase-3 subunit gamma/tau